MTVKDSKTCQEKSVITPQTRTEILLAATENIYEL